MTQLTVFNQPHSDPKQNVRYRTSHIFIVRGRWAGFIYKFFFLKVEGLGAKNLQCMIEGRRKSFEGAERGISKVPQTGN